MTEEIKIVAVQDKNYPKLLKEIPDPPKIIYVRGELNPDEPRFGVVGTRLCSPYGKQAAMEIAGDLAQAGLTIVSGLAPGIDTFAHLAVVERKKRTIAVLGTGLDEKSIYPKENIELSRKILDTGGCLISEYPPGTPGSKITFPRRNRIISGLSLGILVIEAKIKSGALITANFARKQNRKVFALPGAVHSLNSQGPHYLIKTGAKLVENASDILRELKSLRQIKLFEIDKPREISGENQEENLILDALKAGALDIENIIEKTGLPASATASALAILEIQGKVKNLGGNIYAINHR